MGNAAGNGARSGDREAAQQKVGSVIKHVSGTYCSSMLVGLETETCRKLSGRQRILHLDNGVRWYMLRDVVVIDVVLLRMVPPELRVEMAAVAATVPVCVVAVELAGWMRRRVGVRYAVVGPIGGVASLDRQHQQADDQQANSRPVLTIGSRHRLRMPSLGVSLFLKVGLGRLSPDSPLPFRLHASAIVHTGRDVTSVKLSFFIFRRLSRLFLDGTRRFLVRNEQWIALGTSSASSIGLTRLFIRSLAGR